MLTREKVCCEYPWDKLLLEDIIALYTDTWDIEETGTLLWPVPLWMHLIQHIYTGRISDVVSYKFVKIITHVVKFFKTCFISIRFFSFSFIE